MRTNGLAESEVTEIMIKAAVRAGTDTKMRWRGGAILEAAQAVCRVHRTPQPCHLRWESMPDRRRTRVLAQIGAGADHNTKATKAVDIFISDRVSQ